MELWQQRSKRVGKKESLERSRPRPLAERLSYLEKSFESADAFRRYVDVVSRLSNVNPFFDHSSMELAFEDGKVVSLSISCQQVKDLTPVSKLRELQRLDLRGSTFDGGQADISFIRELLKIESFYCKGKIRDLSPLGELPLTVLEIWTCGHSDLSPLAGMRLKKLNCGGSPIKDLAPLKGMPLEWLCINSTDISDLSTLAGMPLKTLMLARTRVTDLSPLDGMQIEFLAINGGTKILDLNQIRQFPLSDFHIDEPERHRELIESFPNLQRLNHKPIAGVKQD